MESGDVVMIYFDPDRCTIEAGPATLIEKLKEYPLNMELWLVAYLNRPVSHEKVLIKNNNEKDTTKG